MEPRSRRHLASFAASIAAHAIVVAMIVYFASPMARGHNEWVLAYLVEGAEGASGLRGGASAAASGAAPMRAPSTAPASAHRAPPSAAARKARRRPAAADVASVAPARAPANTRPRAPADDAAAPLRGAGDPASPPFQETAARAAAPAPPPAAAAAAVLIRSPTRTTPAILRPRIRSWPDATSSRAPSRCACSSVPTAVSNEQNSPSRPASTRWMTRRCRPCAPDGASFRPGTAESQSKAGCWCPSGLLWSRPMPRDELRSAVMIIRTRRDISPIRGG